MCCLCRPLWRLFKPEQITIVFSILREYKEMQLNIPNDYSTQFFLFVMCTSLRKINIYNPVLSCIQQTIFLTDY